MPNNTLTAIRNQSSTKISHVSVTLVQSISTDTLFITVPDDGVFEAILRQACMTVVVLCEPNDLSGASQRKKFMPSHLPRPIVSPL